jgi:predicted dehydrogenase
MHRKRLGLPLNKCLETTMISRRDVLKQSAHVAVAWQVGTKLVNGEEKKKTPIKVGQVGVGHAHASKLGVFRKSPDYEVVGIAEADPKLKQQAESQPAYRDLKWMSGEQLLNVPGLQLVLVETLVPHLLDAAEESINAGKHVHLDKPAGTSLQQYRRILESAQRQKLLVQMGYMYRYNPAVVRLRDFMKKGWLGELFEVHTVMSKVVGEADRKKFAAFPGGMMFELGCHITDLVVGLLGKPKQVTSVLQHASSIDDKLMDNTLATFTYDRAVATVKSSALEVDGGERRHLVACGSQGTFHIQPLDDPRALVTLNQPREEYKKGYQELQFPKYVRYVDDAADIARVIRGEKQSDFSYEHDWIVQETLLKACGVENG